MQPERGLSRILIVEDDALMRSTLKRVLDGLAIIDEAEDGGDALDLLAQHRYAVAIVDVGLDRLSGDTLVWTSRALHGPEMMVVLISGRSEDTLADLARCGANATLGKPFSAAALLAIVKPWLKREELH